jgi:hypothetical protein
MRDDFKALKYILKSQRHTNKRQNMVMLNRLERAGALQVQRFNNGLHLRLTNPATGAVIDFYPSTNRIRAAGESGRVGTLAEALRRINVNVKEG